jgi:hypothetical protein
MSNNEPDSIQNATHNTFAIIFHVESRFTLQMYCGLHFNSVGLIITCEIPYIQSVQKYCH